MLLWELEGAGVPETEHTVKHSKRPARLVEDHSGQRDTVARRMSARSVAAGMHSHGGRGGGTSGGARVRTNGRKLKQAWDPVHAYGKQSYVFHLRVLPLRLTLPYSLSDMSVYAMQVRIFMPFKRAARMSSLTPPMLWSAEGRISDAGIPALSGTADAPAPAPSSALMTGQASTASASHGIRSFATSVEMKFKAARPTAHAIGLDLLKRSGSLRHTLPAPSRLPPRTPHYCRKPGTSQRVLADALEDHSAALQPEHAEIAVRMHDADMHADASACSSEELCNRTAWQPGAGQQAVGKLRDVDGIAADLAKPDANAIDIATPGSPALTGGDTGISETSSGTSTPPSNRVTNDSNSTDTGGPAEPAKPLQAVPSLGAALARSSRKWRHDPIPDSIAQQALPLANALARLRRASLERVRQLQSTASDGRGRSGDLESFAGNASNAAAGTADAGQDGGGALLGGELLVTVVDAQVEIILNLSCPLRHYVPCSMQELYKFAGSSPLHVWW